MTAQIDAGVRAFTNANSLIQDGQSCAGAVVVYSTGITWAEPQLEVMSAQKDDLPALEKSLELRKDKTQMAGVTLLSLISMGAFIRGVF